MTLFVISIITLVDRFNLANVRLYKSPASNYSSYRGSSLWRVTSSCNIDITVMRICHLSGKNQRLNLEEYSIETRKLPYWDPAFNLSHVQTRKKQYQQRVQALSDQIQTYENLRDDGLIIEGDLRAQNPLNPKLYFVKKQSAT